MQAWRLCAESGRIGEREASLVEAPDTFNQIIHDTNILIQV